MKRLYEMRKGHPPMSELKGRVVIKREVTFKPPFDGYEGCSNELECLQYDADGLAKGMYGYDELIEGPDDRLDTHWELFDPSTGTVWTTYHDTLGTEDL